MIITQSIGNVKFTIDDNRPENEKINKPIKIIIGDVEIIIGHVNQQKLNCNKNNSQKSKQKKINHVTYLDIDSALKTSRDDDFVLVRKMFLEKFNCEFRWKEDDIYEFIGEYNGKYNERATIKFLSVTRHPMSHVGFWASFYDSKN